MTYSALKTIGALVMGAVLATTGLAKADHEDNPVGWTEEVSLYKPGMFFCKSVEDLKISHIDKAPRPDCSSNNLPVFASVEIVEHWPNGGKLVIIAKVTIVGFLNGTMNRLPEPAIMYSVWSFDGGHGQAI